MAGRVCEVLFMPWAGIGKDTNIGPFTAWAWKKSRVKDPALAEHLEKYFEAHVDHYGRPVSSITILSTDDSFGPISPQLMDKARIAVDCLLFSVIYPTVKAAVRNDNPNNPPPTADRYQLVKQRFVPGESSFTVSVGGTSHVGEIGKLKVTCPWDLGGTSFPDEELLRGLSALLGRRVKALDRHRIARSLEWFRLAHTSGAGPSELTKAVMMSTAFEVLFSLPRYQKTHAFISAVRKCLDRSNTRTQTATDALGKQQTYSLPGWWADDFYDLRSRVVHGDPVKPSRLKYKRWLTHLIAADLVFGECLRRELYDLKLIENDIRTLSKQCDRLCPDQPNGWYEKHFKDRLNGDHKTHQQLGWIPKRTK